MADRHRSLRTVVFASLAAIAAITLGTAVALVGITSLMRDATRDLAHALERAQRAQEAAALLLLHGRLEDPVALVSMESQIRAALADAGEGAPGPLVARVTAAVDGYLAERERTGRAGPALDRAFAEIDALAEADAADAQRAERRAARLDRLANGLGLGTALALCGVVLALVAWLRGWAVRPVLALAQAMERFARGDAEARAPERGADEIASMSRRFNEMAESLARQRRAQLDSIASVAHDLRTPMSALKLATAAARAPGDGHAGREGKLLAVVRRQVERLDVMLGDLLDSARIEAGRLALRREEVDLRAVVSSAVDLFAGASASHRVAADVPDAPVTASCDPQRVEQVLVNLLSNAIKYSPEGGAVDVTLRTDGSAARLEVADEGLGIAPGEEETVFEPYHRSRRTRDLVPGAGLGLHAVRRIVEAHGGGIRVAPRPGGGTVFSLTLPLRRDEAGVADAPARPGAR